ncbi:MAG: diol dehydratase small subunit [Bacillota bacterium]|jgi:propanediol dehydratase small subunit|uniref:Diol dehydratase small subunit n=1 Tax=Thermanaerosceptrum fracticalcis TaxID=1712410 RepID=A0A7G6E7E9_THEFR|nr:diol dehydratase small subunit [Thermanaerosceptrum fracticalcis]QNB48003.1 diol dehydratase small subunit [Thermanaerosceptrum fracticalcis]
MIQEKMIEDLVRQVLQNLVVTPAPTASPATGSQDLDPEKDYPLAVKRPELVKTPTGKGLKDITLEKVINNEIKAEDLRITPETLRIQAQIAEGVGRVQFANNLRRAAELTAVPDQRILEIYNALRPYRSTKQELLDIADELESQYQAKINAAFVREAAEVYARRNRLRAE